MKEYLERLDNLVEEVARKPVLSRAENRIFCLLKTKGEKAVRGREIDKHEFEVKEKSGLLSLCMKLEGRSAMPLARQLCERFEDRSELKFARVFETKRGAQLVLRVNG